MASIAAAACAPTLTSSPSRRRLSVSACLEAYRATSDLWWYEQAQRAFDWFIGWNDLGLRALLPGERRLRRWIARGSGQWEPGSGIHAGLPAVPGGDAPGAKHGDELQGADRRRAVITNISLAPLENHLMSAKPINVKRTATILRPDQSRVLLRPFNPGDRSRAGKIIARIMSLPEGRVGPLLDEVCARFSARHQQHRRPVSWNDSSRSARLVPPGRTVRTEATVDRLLFPRRVLPRVRRPVQSLHRPAPRPDGAASGALRFILSLRATGEGHISSITFRTGVIHADRRIEVKTPADHLTEPRQIPNPSYEKALFERKLYELGLTGEFTRRVMDTLGRIVHPGRACAPMSKRN